MIYPERRELLPTPVFFPGEFYGQRNLVSYGLWGQKELDTTERHIYTHIADLQHCVKVSGVQQSNSYIYV